MIVLIFAAALTCFAVAGFVITQGVRYYRGVTPRRANTFLERALDAQQNENNRLREALEEIYATRYSPSTAQSHDDCVAIANKALKKARAER